MGEQPHRMIAAARAIQRQTQAQLAEELTRVSGEEWTRNGVAAIENGNRAFKVEDLMVFAKAQGRPYGWYLGTVDGGVPSEALGGYLASAA